MSRMMPAKVRAEGIALYKEGLLTELSQEQYAIQFDVDDAQVKYDLDGTSDFCSCEDFQRTKRYCKHIAAVEEFLKANEEQMNAEASAIDAADNDEEQSYKAGADFLTALEARDQTVFSRDDSYRLEAKIGDTLDLYDVFSRQRSLYLDLRIRSKKLDKAYVIKDVDSFLIALRRNESYAAAKLQIERMSLDLFDEASQSLLQFLLSITEKEDEAFSQQLLLKSGRYLRLPLLFVEPILDLLADLRSHELEIDGRKLNYFSYLELGDRAEGAEELFSFKVESQQDAIELQASAEDFLSFYDERLLYFDHVFYHVNSQQDRLIRFLNQSLLSFEGESKILFAYADKDKLARGLELLASIGKIDAAEFFRIKNFKPAFAFGISDDEKALKLDIQFDYGDFILEHFQELETLDFSRDLKKEARIFDLMDRFDFPRSFHGQIAIEPGFVEDFFLEMVPAFEALGQVQLSRDLSFLRIDQIPKIEIDRKGSLLDISFDLPNVSDSEFSGLVKKLQEDADYYVSESGRFYQLSGEFDQLKAALREMDDAYEIQGNHLTISASRTFQVSRIFEGLSSSELSEAFKDFYRQLTQPELFPYEKPAELNANLRPYQETGVKWLSMLSHYNLGGILADDMGLGKTLQAIVFLLSNLKAGERVLITAPASLTYNWASEFKKFAPSLDIEVIDGSKPERDEKIASDHQVYITSYGSFLKDVEAYNDKELTYLLLDEAQVVKNYSSKTNKALMALDVDYSFALSGTPLENRIEEIWAIFQVIMPGFLPKREKFNKMPSESIARMIQPFIMRRKKEDVLEELPDKMEKVLLNSLEDEQKKLYLAQLQVMQSQVSGMSSQDLSRSRMEILAGITRLRQICDTPALFIEDYQGGSGKMESLRELLVNMKASGHRPLIFSQFTKLFPEIEKMIEELGMSNYRLTGSTQPKERLSMVQAFNAGSRDAFLISLKAGGVGLNLTSADVVILVDLWWNPAVEEQAIARAHRMGQKNRVEVIRLITQGTIEERMIAIQDRKKDLIANVLDGDAASSSLSESEIREILGL
ncbi:DEAD/DEAH box helicase [Lactococcus termiticola]|uniref:SNF2 family DNA/RNA helicase n=1 Tax=Lactococcus termiticola TaxID=2169526 RepID=A0A2R5HFB8_9LACT|nr:SNF2-related protein [Lactococcus termiticola]GBG96526.1 SNF2 family DNA/RNA helicase [Lactococcus termiticola]